MEIIKPDTFFTDSSNAEHSTNSMRISFDPLRNDGKTLVCCCGFELVKSDDDLYRCTGGSHTYRISEGDVEMDKFGNMLFRIPQS